MKNSICIVLLCICILLMSSCNTQQNVDFDLTVIQDYKVLETLPTIKLDKSDYDMFCEYIDYDNIECPHSELFGIEEALKEKESRVFSVNKHTYDFFKGEKEVNAEKLYDVVKENNDKYMEGVGKHFNKKLSNSKLKECCEIITDTLNWGIENIEGIDLSELGCIIGNLKILNRGTMNLGTFNDKNDLLNVSPSMIKAKKERNGNGDMYELTICHETMHILQCRCIDVPQNKEDSFIGTSYSFENLGINPMKCSWLYEASAELNATQRYYSNPTTYAYMIDNLESISLSSILAQNVQARQLEKLCFTKDNQSLYEQIGFSEKNKSIEFLYVVELLRNKPDDFKKVYEKAYGSINDYDEFLKITYNPYFVEVTSKLLYKNLALRLLVDDISLNDVFYIISLYELDLLKDIPLDNDDVKEKYINIYEQYIQMRSNFFDIMQNHASIEVVEAFEKFEINYGDNLIYANASLEWLDAEKREYLLHRNRVLYNEIYLKQKNRI